MPARALVLLSTLLAACGTKPVPDGPTGAVAAERVPNVVVPTDAGLVDIASLAGQPVVLQFAEPGDPAWDDLADALADLEAAGATVLSVPVDGVEREAAEAFGFEGPALAVVVDGEGTVRGRTETPSGEDLFALASPVLAEADIAETVAWQGAHTLDALVGAGGLIVQVGEEASLRLSLHIAADTLTAADLPADLGTPLAFVGQDAEDAAQSALRWGYAAVYVADDEETLTEVRRAPPTPPSPARRSGGARG
ncbi:MAG: hypothetical protein AAGK21_08915 [Bacteroidota bacterium]